MIILHAPPAQLNAPSYLIGVGPADRTGLILSKKIKTPPPGSPETGLWFMF